MNIVVVVPTIRIGDWMKWLDLWKPLLRKHSCILVKVQDGGPLKQKALVLREPNYVLREPNYCYTKRRYTTEEELDASSFEGLEDRTWLVPCKSPACRNLGFLVATKFQPDVIMTFDDDTKPIGDPIADHLSVLKKRVPISWMSTASMFPRGFPYRLREEAPVMLSHGIWTGTPDLDAPTRMILGYRYDLTFAEGPIPKGIFFPMCGMNVAFRAEALPYMFWAPVKHLPGAERFDDIWCGIFAKQEFDARGWAVYTGGAVVEHMGLPDPLLSLTQEALGIQINEDLWREEPNTEFFHKYSRARQCWRNELGGRIACLETGENTT